jgi:TPR repeat protein
MKAILILFVLSLLPVSAYSYGDKAACLKGNADECYNIASAYENGFGVEINPEKAFKWYLKGAEYGEKYSQSKLAEFYKKGFGVKKDQNLSDKWFKKGEKVHENSPLKESCINGDGYDCLSFGNYYFGGELVKKDYKEALKWFKKGLEGSGKNLNEKLEYNIGLVFHLGGYGVQKNLTTATIWYAKAAEKNNKDAQNNLKSIINSQKEKNDSRRLLGKRVCSTWSNGENGWCGDVTEIIGDSLRIENYSIFCGKGGFLGICTNITVEGKQLFTDDSGQRYDNPRTLIMSKYGLD